MFWKLYFLYCYQQSNRITRNSFAPGRGWIRPVLSCHPDHLYPTYGVNTGKAEGVWRLKESQRICEKAPLRFFDNKPEANRLKVCLRNISKGVILQIMRDFNTWGFYSLEQTCVSLYSFSIENCSNWGQIVANTAFKKRRYN